MNEEKKEGLDVKPEEKKEEVKMRQILIETDGDTIKIVKMEIAGLLELRGILNGLMTICDNPPKKK